jgi:hypothetical protein
VPGKHSPHYFTIGQDGSMDSCCLRQILTLPSVRRNKNQDSLDQAMFFNLSIVQCWWSHIHLSRFFLFLADRSVTRCGCLLQQPIRDKYSRVVCFKMPFCTPLLYRAVICWFLPFSFDLSSTSCFHPQDCRWLDVFCLFHHSQ